MSACQKRDFEGGNYDWNICNETTLRINIWVTRLLRTHKWQNRSAVGTIISMLNGKFLELNIGDFRYSEE